MEVLGLQVVGTAGSEEALLVANRAAALGLVTAVGRRVKVEGT